MKNDFIEEWKDIKGYEGYYMVSNLGRVYESPRKYIGGYGHIKCRKKVGQYTIDGELIRIYESINEAARLTNITSCNISNVLKGRQKTSGGFIWKYAE